MSKLGNRAVSKAPKQKQAVDFGHIDTTLKNLAISTYSPFRLEILVFGFAVCYLLIQNFNIYRYNLYNFNFHALALSIIILARRLVIKLWVSMRRRDPLFGNSVHRLLGALVFLVLILFNSLYCAAQLFKRHSWMTCLFLFLPSLVSGLLRMFSTSSASKVPASLQLSRSLRKVVATSLEFAYICGYLPISFLSFEYIYYNPTRILIVIVYIFLNTLVLLSCKLLYTRFIELFFQSANLGGWTSTHIKSMDTSSLPEYAVNEVYAKGIIVRYHDKTYIALGEHNTALPADKMASLLHFLFGEPDRTHMALIGFQAIMVLSSLVIVFRTNHWTVYGPILLINQFLFICCIYVRRKNRKHFWAVGQ